jgi:hypothetical protein
MHSQKYQIKSSRPGYGLDWALHALKLITLHRTDSDLAWTGISMNLHSKMFTQYPRF